jgi:hypothetical protein
MRSGGGAGSMTSVPGTLAELGYDLAQRALDQQERVLDDLRTRTGTLLTATALVATFLGGRVLDSGTNKVLALTGAAFAIGCIVLCVLALAPRRGVYAAVSGSGVRRRLVERDKGIEDAYVDLADWLEGVWRSNQVIIQRLVVAFRASSECWSPRRPCGRSGWR